MRSQKTITKEGKRSRLFEETNGCCFYCGFEVEEYGYHSFRDWLPLKNVDMVVEHKTPLIRGGSSLKENLVCACADCNARKGMFTAEEFRLIVALQKADLNFRFAGEEPAATTRDWLICHSDSHERDIVVVSFPDAITTYGLRRNAHKRSKTWRPQGSRQ